MTYPTLHDVPFRVGMEMQQGPVRGLSSKGAERHPSGKSTRTFDLIFGRIESIQNS